MANHGLAGLCAIALSIGAWSASAEEQAQTTGPQSARAASDTSLQEIVVSAQRRSERLQDVPISVAVITGDQLEAKGVVSTIDLGHATTGLIMEERDATVVPYIRGVGSDTNILGEVGDVATYIDGVYMPDPTAGVYDLLNIDSVEVLKGPQGTLFGRNTVGGAINIRTKEPQFHPSGSVDGSYGNFNEAALRGYFTGPISDTVAFSVAAAYKRQDSYIHDLIHGGKIANIQRYSFRGVVLLKPVERLNITLTADAEEDKDAAAVAVSAIGGYIGQTPSSPVSNNPYDYIGSVVPKQVARHAGLAGRIEYDFDFARLTSLTAYRWNLVNSVIEVDRTPFVLVDLGDHSPIRVLSQELQLASNSSGPLKWLVGGYFAHQIAKYDPVTLVGSFAGGRTEIENVVYEQSYAGFANATYKLGDFELTAGIRSSSDRKGYTGAVNGFALVTETMAHHRWNSQTPRGVVAYHPSRDFMLYASYAEGYKEGAYNTASFTLTPVNPETIKAYEIGLKSSPQPWMILNSALFFYDRKNVQVEAQDPITNLQSLQNAAASRSKGAEVDLNLRPVSQMSLQAGITYLDAVYTNFHNAIAYVPTPVPAGAISGSLGNTALSEDVSGTIVERSPKWTFILSGSYSVELPNGGSVVPSLNLFSTSQYFFDRGYALRQPGYTTLDAEIKWNLADARTSVSLWGKNITDRKYYRDYVANNFAFSAITAPPGMYGIRIAYKF